MADWTLLNGVERGAKAGDTGNDEDGEEGEGEKSKDGKANFRGSVLSRQRSRESPGSRGSSNNNRHSKNNKNNNNENDDLVSILASDESLVPPSKLGYQNDLALALDNGLIVPKSELRCGNNKDDDNNDDNNEPEDNESSNILDNRHRNNAEESGATIRREAREELDRNNQLNRGKTANGKQQPHVQFNPCDAPDNEKVSPPPTSSSTSSSSSSSSSEDLAEARAPDGGYGWVVVAAAFMVNLIADGITFSFGVIFHEFLLYFGEGKATTSWIGSLFMAMPLLSGPIASFLTDRYGCRRVTIAGSVLATSGFILSYFATSLEMLVLTFGVLAGFGLSLCFVAAVVIVAYYFEKRRSFATGLSVCGSGIGTFIFPPLIQRLLDEYGWRGTTLVLSGLFLNLAVCGALMRDLEWTKPKSKARRRQLERERKLRSRMMQQSSSADSFSASSSANTAQTLQLHGSGAPEPTPHATSTPNNNYSEHHPQLFSSLVSLPTFVKNGEKVPLEVLELLSAKKNVYDVLVQNYPSLLISSRSFSDSSGLHEPLSPPSARFVPVLSPLVNELDNATTVEGDKEDKDEFGDKLPRQTDWWLRDKMLIDPAGAIRPRRNSASEPHQHQHHQNHHNHCHPRRFTTAYLKDIRMHRHSLTYRGAMLNINRYRLRASSCPDILRNSMTTIAKEEQGYAGLREFKDLIVNIFDLTHFREPIFTLFAMSNFLLHTWYDVPYMYLTDNAIEMGFSESQASYLISIIGIMNMAGEIMLGWAGDCASINSSVVYAICMALTGCFAALIPAVIKSYYLLSAIAGAFGFFIAANYSLTSIILVEAITIERFTNAYGLLLFVQGIANLMGPPIAGWLYDITGSYDLSFYLAGGFIAMSGAMLLVKPLLGFYRKLKEKAAARRRAKNVGQSAMAARPDINSV